MLKTKKYSKTVFVLLLTTTFLSSKAESLTASNALEFVSSIFFDRCKKERVRRNRLAPEYIQNNAIKIYKEMDALCQKHPIIGQFVINFDKPSKRPQVYHNIYLSDQQLGYSEPPGTAIYISTELNRNNFVDSLEEGVITREIARCVLGHNNPFSGHIVGLTRGENQLAFEVETLTVFYLLKEEKFGTLKKYLLKASEGSSNVFSINSSSENVCYKIGQANGIAAYKKEFPNYQLINKIIESITKDASTQKLIENFQFTNSYKDAKKQFDSVFKLGEYNAPPKIRSVYLRKTIGSKG